MKRHRFLIAPTSFKGTLSPLQAARAMASGLDQPCEICPLADGGEGTLEVVEAALGGALHTVQVTGSHGRPVKARVLLRPGGAALLETADVVGLGLVPAHERDPSGLVTTGIAELIEAALELGATSLDIGLGGSGTADGGAGLLEAFARPLPVPTRALTDVDAVLLGQAGALARQAGARRFMEQKGARPDQLDGLEARLAEVAARFPGTDPAAPGAGAAGGLGFALMALGAERVAGAEWVAEMVGLDERVRAATVIVTGEGELDDQTVQGKSIAALCRRALGRPIAVFCGRSRLDDATRARLGLALVHELGPPSARPAVTLEAAVRERTGDLQAL